jgi:hypothetical protein
MTLRKLTWMYQEKKRVEGELTAWMVSMICAHMPFVNARLNPRSINPYRAPGAARKIEEVRNFIAMRGLAALASLGKDPEP